MALEQINCPACNLRHEADTAHGDPGKVCCEFCARFTCPGCGFIFFRPLPEFADRPPGFFIEARKAHEAEHGDSHA